MAIRASLPDIPIRIPGTTCSNRVTSSIPDRANISELSAVIEADTSWILFDLLSAVTITSSIKADVPSAYALDPNNDEIATAKTSLLFFVKFFMIFSLMSFDTSPIKPSITQTYASNVTISKHRYYYFVLRMQNKVNSFYTLLHF